MLPSNTRLTEIITVYHSAEEFINNVIFNFSDGTCKQLGWDKYRGRTESIVLAENECLVGAKIEHSKNFLMAITWITTKKMRI